MTPGRKAILRFFLQALGALVLQGLPFLYTLLEGDDGTLLYFLHLYAVMPLAAFFLAAWAGAGGVHPLAAFFPVGGALLFLPVYESMGMGLGCLLLSLVGAVAGQEWKKRGQPAKGGHHGGKKKK